MKAKNILILFLIPVAIVIDACKDKGTEPPHTKSPRDYSWDADTITYPGSFIQTEMLDIWGSSLNDVYGVGFNNAFENVEMWHYEGKDWSDVKLWGLYQIRSTSINAIYGFSSNDVWAVGLKGYDYADSSLIIHYDGSKWSEANIIRSSKGLNDIYGSSPNDVWACGWGGVVYHYDGIKWNKDSISVYNPQGAEFQLESIVESNTVYVMGQKHENILGRDTYYFFKKSNQTWQIIDSLVSGSSTYAWGTRLWVSPEGNLYSYRDGVFKWNGSSWNDIFIEPYALTSLAGTSEKNIFAVGNYGIAYHYNGNDWYQFPQLKNESIKYMCAWTDGKEAFIAGYNTDSYPMKTIVWHGK